MTPEIDLKRLSEIDLKRLSEIDKEILRVARDYFLCAFKINAIGVQASVSDSFKTKYPNLLESLEKAENEMEDIGKKAGGFDIPELAAVIKNSFYFTKYLLEWHKNSLSWNFEIESAQKAKVFLQAFLDVPEAFKEFIKNLEFQERWEEMESDLKKVLLSLEILVWDTRARANLNLGNYNEASTDFEKAISKINEFELEEMKPIIGISEANLWFAKGMGYQYEEDNYLEAAKAFEKSAKLFNREAARATDIFSEGNYQAYKRISDKRASMCFALHELVEKKPEYKKVQKDIRRVRRRHWRARAYYDY